MEIKPSGYHVRQFFDDVHFYLCLTGIPVLIGIVTVNILVGPATLSEIPEGYEPQEHEYYRSPITRFFVKYWHDAPQTNYEKSMAGLTLVNERAQIRMLEKLVGSYEDSILEAIPYNPDKRFLTLPYFSSQVTHLSYQRGDYQHWAYVLPHAELMTRVSIRDAEIMEERGHPDIS